MGFFDCGGKERGFAARSFWFRNSDHISITASRANGLMSIKLSQPNKQQQLLTNPTILPSLAAPKKQKDVSEMADAEHLKICRKS